MTTIGVFWWYDGTVEVIRARYKADGLTLQFIYDIKM